MLSVKRHAFNKYCSSIKLHRHYCELSLTTNACLWVIIDVEDIEKNWLDNIFFKKEKHKQEKKGATYKKQKETSGKETNPQTIYIALKSTSSKAR